MNRRYLSDLAVARAVHHNESLRAPEREDDDFDVMSLFDEAPKPAADDMDISCILEPTGEFRAIDRNNYDVDCDHTGFFSNSPVGFGRTPLDAIVDLLDNTEPAVVAETYFNPTLPGDRGWKVYDNSGNYGFGRTKDEAMKDYRRERA